MNIRNVLLFLSAMAVTAVASIHLYSGGSWLLDKGKPKKSDKDDITLTVSDDLQSIEINAPKCTPPTKGCFKIDKAKSGEIKFIFVAPDSQWQLTEFKVCKGISKGSLDCNLGLWERLDFFVASDLSGPDLYPTSESGVIDLTQLESGNTTFYLLDQNAIKNEYYYSVKACKQGASPPCIFADPPVINKGRN